MKGRLSQLCDYAKGKVPITELTKSNYISTENMLPNRGGITTATTLPATESTQSYHRNNVLVSNIRPYFKKIWYANNDGGCSNDVLVFQAKNGVAPEYLYYVLADDAFFNYSNATSKGTKMPRGDKTAIMDYEVVEHSIDEQRKIAKILRSLDNKIANNNAINNNLQAQAEALFDNMFPKISDGEKTVGDYITPKRGKNLLSKDAVAGNVPVVAGGLEAATYHNIANTAAPVLTISASGANAGFVNLWHTPVWSSDSSFIDSTMTDNVLFWYVLLKKRQKEIFDAQTGSAQPHIYPQHIAALKLCDLVETDIERFSKQAIPLFNLIGANKTENDSLSALRDTLLPRLMSGEIDVSNVEI